MTGGLEWLCPFGWNGIAFVRKHDYLPFFQQGGLGSAFLRSLKMHLLWNTSNLRMPGGCDCGVSISQRDEAEAATNRGAGDGTRTPTCGNLKWRGPLKDNSQTKPDRFIVNRLLAHFAQQNRGNRVQIHKFLGVPPKTSLGWSRH
jgi:hypothetical protein